MQIESGTRDLLDARGQVKEAKVSPKAYTLMKNRNDLLIVSA